METLTVETRVPIRTKSRRKKLLGWVVSRGLRSLIWNSAMSGSGLAVVGVMVAWVGAVNLSSLAQDFIVRVSSLVSGYSSPLVYLGGIIIATGVSYRYPKTIMFLSSLVVATFYLTPLPARSTIVDSYKLILTLVAVGFFVLAAILLGLKRRHRRQAGLSE